MTTPTNESNSVVDSSITDIEDEMSGGIPTFLQRTHAAPTNSAETSGSTASDGVEQVQEVTPAPVQEEAPAHAPIGHNAPPVSREELIKEFNKDIAAFGKDSGKGAAALPRLGLRVIRAAADGLISTEKARAGEKTDAVRIYEAYAAQDSKHAEHTNGGMKANASKLNSLIGLGCMTTCDGVVVADRAVAIRERMEGAELKPKPLFAGLVDVARAQLASDKELDDAAIEAALTKTAKDKSVEKEWERIEKAVEKLVTGENAAGLKDQSEGALKISELIHEHVSQFKNSSDDVEMVEGLMEKGHSRSHAEVTVRPGQDNGWSM